MEVPGPPGTEVLVLPEGTHFYPNATQYACSSFPYISSVIIFVAATMYMILFASWHIIQNLYRFYKHMDKRNEFVRKFPQDHENDGRVYFNDYCFRAMVERDLKKILDRLECPHVLKVQQAIDGESSAKPTYAVDRFRVEYAEYYIYPTISDSIADGNAILRRIFNILTTAAALLLCAYLWLEYLTFDLDDQVTFLVYYILELICVITLIFVPLFPNNSSRISPSWCIPLTGKFHLLGIFFTVTTMIAAISFYLERMRQKNHVVPLVIILFSLALFFAALFALCSLLRNYPFSFGHTLSHENVHALACCLLYFSETGLLLSIVLCFVFSSWYKAETLTCFPTEVFFVNETIDTKPVA